jgi:hypothetical protein
MYPAVKFRIDVAIHDLLTNAPQAPRPAEAKGLTLPRPVFPQFPERLNDPGPDTPPEKRRCLRDIHRISRGWLFVCPISRNAGRIPPDYRVPIH